MSDSPSGSRFERRENNIRNQTSFEIRYQALQDLGDSLRQAARDFKRVILNGDATPDDLRELQPPMEKNDGLV